MEPLYSLLYGKIGTVRKILLFGRNRSLSENFNVRQSPRVRFMVSLRSRQSISFRSNISFSLIIREIPASSIARDSGE